MPVTASHGTVRPAMFDALVNSRSSGVLDQMRRATSRSGGSDEMMYPSVPSIASVTPMGSGMKRPPTVSFKEPEDGTDTDSDPGSDTETVRHGTIKKLCKQIESLQNELVVRDQECLEAHEKYEVLLSRNITAMEGYGGMSMVQKQVVCLQQELEAAHSKIEALQGESEILQKEIHKLRKHEAHQGQHVLHLENELSSTRHHEASLVEHLKTEVKELKAALSEATLAYTELVNQKCSLQTTTTGCNTMETGSVTARELELVQEMRQLRQAHEDDMMKAKGITATELAGLLETVRKDLDGQLLDLRQQLIAHHVEGQMKLKSDTEKRLSELTMGVEEKLQCLHHTAALQEEYGLQASSVADLEKEIASLATQRKEKELVVRELRNRSLEARTHSSPTHTLINGEMSSLLTSLRRSQARSPTPTRTVTDSIFV